MISQEQLDQQVKGLRFTGGAWKGYSDEALRDHVIAWYAAYEQTGIALALTCTAGKSAEELLSIAREQADAKKTRAAKINRRYAGARALRAKYGDDVAEKIIRSHKG